MKIDIHIKVYHKICHGCGCPEHLKCLENTTFSLDADSSTAGDIKTLYEARSGTPADKQVLVHPHVNHDKDSFAKADVDEATGDILEDTMKLTKEDNDNVYLLFC